MAACIKAPAISLPDLPGLDLVLPSLSFSTPDLSLNLCCNFELPPIPIDPDLVLKAIALLITTLLQIPGASALIALVNAAVQEAVAQLNVLLDQLQFSCPLD